MSKLILSGMLAKEALLEGVKKLNDAVSETLGPLGNNVAIDKKWESPQVVHDGVTVAKEIDLENPFENMGAKLVRQASDETNKSSGDGTTTSTILAYTLASEGKKFIDKGVLPMKLRREMLQASNQALIYLTSKAKKVSTPEEIKQIAIISAQDEEIGTKVSEAIAKTGLDGVITVEDGMEKDITVEFKEGMQFDRGYISPYLSTNDQMSAEVEEPYVLVTNHSLTQTAEVTGILQDLISVSKNIVIIADDILPPAQLAIISYKLKGSFNILALRSPGYGDNRVEQLKDICAITAATFIDQVTRPLSSIMVGDLGRASKVICTADTTTIVGGDGDTSERIYQIKEQIKKAKDEFNKERLQVRLSKLTSGAAIIHVGAATEGEMKEKKERVIDAVAATRAAIEEGIIPGGATTLLRASKAIFLTGDEGGGQIVQIALASPFKKLIENSGLDVHDSLISVLDAKDNEGIDVMDGQLKDLLEAGIIDPVKVVKQALKNAVSVAGSILTTNVLITEKEEKKHED